MVVLSVPSLPRLIGLGIESEETCLVNTQAWLGLRGSLPGVRVISDLWNETTWTLMMSLSYVPARTEAGSSREEGDTIQSHPQCVLSLLCRVYQKCRKTQRKLTNRKRPRRSSLDPSANSNGPVELWELRYMEEV